MIEQRPGGPTAHRCTGRRTHGVNRLRRRYFAEAAGTAGRHGVTFNDLLNHLWATRRSDDPVHLDAVRHLDQLTLAVACRRGEAAAWQELAEDFEPWMTERLRRATDDVSAQLRIRRFLHALRGPDASEAPTDIPHAMDRYRGYQPLRVWLAAAMIDAQRLPHHIMRDLELSIMVGLPLERGGSPASR